MRNSKRKRNTNEKKLSAYDIFLDIVKMIDDRLQTKEVQSGKENVLLISYKTEKQRLKIHSFLIKHYKENIKVKRVPETVYEINNILFVFPMHEHMIKKAEQENILSKKKTRR